MRRLAAFGEAMPDNIGRLLHESLRSIHSLISSRLDGSADRTIEAGEAIAICDFARQLEDAGKTLRSTARSILDRYEETATDHIEHSGKDAGRCGAYSYHVSSAIKYRVTDSRQFHDWGVRAGLSVYVIAEALRSEKALSELCADLLIAENAIPLGVARYPHVKLVRRRASV